MNNYCRSPVPLSTGSADTQWQGRLQSERGAEIRLDTYTEGRNKNENPLETQNLMDHGYNLPFSAYIQPCNSDTSSSNSSQAGTMQQVFEIVNVYKLYACIKQISMCFIDFYDSKTCRATEECLLPETIYSPLSNFLRDLMGLTNLESRFN